MEKTNTAELSERTYGIHLTDNTVFNGLRGRSFVQPLSYALAQIMLERPGEIRARIRDFAQRNGLSDAQVEQEFVQAVLKREKAKNLLNFSRRIPGIREANLAVKDINYRGGKIIASTKTKSRKGFVDSYLGIPSRHRSPNVAFNSGRSENKGNFYASLKGDFSFMDHHLAALHILLCSEWELYKSIQTRTFDVDLKKVFGYKGPPTLPFSFNFFGRELSGRNLQRHQALTDLVINYYLEEQKQSDANIAALNNSCIYSPELVREIIYENGNARFEMIREREQTRKTSALTQKEKDFYDATTNLLEQIDQALGRSGFCQHRYAREPGLGIARRYESKKGRSGLVYNVATTPDGLPIIVKRILGEKVGNLALTRSEPSIDELIHSEAFEDVDDVSRRVSNTTVIVPGYRFSRRRLVVPPILKPRYDALREQKN